MSAAKRAKMGRPTLPEGKARAVVFTVRLSPEELESLRAAATRLGQPVTQWARESLLAASDLT